MRLKRKILCLVLSFLMLTGSVSLFSSCRSSKGSVSLDLSKYKVIFAYGVSEMLEDCIYDLCDALGEKTGAAPKREIDSGKETVVNDDYEILIGKTLRPETEEALSKVSGDGYTVAVIGNKLVIAGTNNLFTYQAISYFSEKYLSGQTIPDIAKKEVFSNCQTVLINAGYQLVYGASLDDKDGCVYGSDYRTDTENPDAWDYPVVAAHQIASAIRKVTGENESDFGFIKDTRTKEYEIRVGWVDRQETTDFLSAMDADEYGFSVGEKTVTVAGQNDVMLRAAVSLFLDAIKDGATRAGDRTEIRIPLGLKIIKTSQTSWRLDFPRPIGENIQLSGSVDVSDRSLELYYTGSGVSAAAYRTYCDGLKAAGYEVRSENSIEGSLFTQFANESAGITLYVTYAAFSHAKEESVKIYNPAFRIVSAPLSAVNLPDDELLNEKQTYKKLTDSRITSMQLDYGAWEDDDGNWGNAYILTLEDGSFVVIDGGGSNRQPTDRLRLFRVLRDLYTQAHGTEPTVAAPITIAAWYLTHQHYDHYANFVDFCGTYGSQVRVERVFANFPSDSECYNSYDPNQTVRNGLPALSRKVLGGMKYYKLHSGQKLYLRNLELEVLYTHEDIYPNTIDMFNETFTVIRFTVHNTDGKGNRQGKSTSMLWLGDLHTKGSQCLRAMYGSYLKSDMAQMAHHGYEGCELRLYQLAAPTLLFWPAGFDTAFWWEIDDYFCDNDGNYEEFQEINYRVVRDISSIKYILVADRYNTTITLTKNGPDYNHLYDAGGSGSPSFSSGLTKSPLIRK